jgi:acyl-CoA synthetase (NDP forming)
MTFDFDQIDRIINARSIALVGASSSPMKFGTMYTVSQVSVGFDGPMYLVNPREKEILGRPAYPDLGSLPEVPDLVCLMIPAHRSIEVLRDCARLGVKGVVMIASGFSEIGEEGRKLEEEALGLAEEGGFRIIGPNCFGIYNPRTGLTLLPGYDFSKTPGDTAFISQSGGFSVHLARQGQSLGIGFSAVVSYGNAADLDEADLLRYFARDPQTAYIAGYLEGTRDGRAFIDALTEAAAAKPVIIWKVGRSQASRRATVSHTGSLAGSSELWSAALRQAGAIEASGIDETTDILITLKTMGRRPGRRLLISGGGGGLGAYGADVACSEGLEVPDLAPESLSRLQKALDRAGAVPGNPLDIGTPMVPAPVFADAMRAAALNPTTDVLVFDLAVNFAFPIAGPEGLQKACDILIETRAESGKPVAVVLYSRACDPGGLAGEDLLRKLRQRLLDGGVAAFGSWPRAMRAIARTNQVPFG